MVSGGLQVLEDRMYGYHEGYLVTPISTGALVTGNVLAGAVVASLAGGLVLAAILMLTPVRVAGGAAVAAGAATVFLTALAISAVWFLLFARARNASVLRGMFGIINALLFFPSGALYPVESYPPWLQAVSKADPLTYGLNALRDLVLRGSHPSAVYADWVFLLTFALVCGVLTRVLFRREI
jgi:ABC-2 type transport system permease protein